MRVDQTTNNPVQGSEASATKHARKTHGTHHAHNADQEGEAKGASTAANAEVSDRAREMASARAAANEAPDVREDKIAELKARIAGGSYHVDGHAVADRMVDDHIRMSGIG